MPIFCFKKGFVSKKNYRGETLYRAISAFAKKLNLGIFEITTKVKKFPRLHNPPVFQILDLGFVKTCDEYVIGK